MRTRVVTVVLALTAGFSSAALAQRALRSKDAPAPLPETPADAGSSAPSEQAPQASQAPQTSAPTAPKPKRKGQKIAAPVDAGPYFAPTFKDDLTPAEIARANANAAALDCGGGRCEGVFRKRVARHEWVVHVRPAQPQPGQVTEVVVDVSELLEVPDPELGDKKPLEGLALTAHLEGIGRYEMHPIEGSSGSYGAHFTPQSKGSLRLQIESADASAVPTVEFQLPIGQPGPKGYEVRSYEPRYSDPVAWSMADLGSAWGGLWGAALGTGRGDAAVLEATVQRLAKNGLDEWPPRASSDREDYRRLASSFADAAQHLVGVKPAGLKDAMSAMERQQCERCHVAYAWGLTKDVSEWPQIKIGTKEEE